MYNLGQDLRNSIIAGEIDPENLCRGDAPIELLRKHVINEDRNMVSSWKANFCKPLVSFFFLAFVKQDVFILHNIKYKYFVIHAQLYRRDHFLKFLSLKVA